MSCEALYCDCCLVLRYITLSRCHDDDDTVRCLPVPGVSHTECHTRVPVCAPLSVSPPGSLALSGCTQPGVTLPRLPPSRVTWPGSWHGRHQTLASQHRPGRAGQWGCSAHLSQCPHPGTWSLVTLVTGHPSHPAIPDPPCSPVTIITPASFSWSPSSISRLPWYSRVAVWQSRWPSERGPSSVSHPSLIMSVTDYTRFVSWLLHTEVQLMLVLMHKILSSATIQKSSAPRVMVAAVSCPVSPGCHLRVLSPVSLLTTRPSLRGECRIAQCRQVMVTSDAERERHGKSFHLIYGTFRRATNMRQLELNQTNLHF